MAKHCNNCNEGQYFIDTLNLEKLKSDNYNEGIMCNVSGLDTTPDNSCETHSYIEGMEEYDTYVLYDDKYLGKGYFIISELDGEIVKFIKIYVINEYGFNHYALRAYEKDSIDKEDQIFRTIEITVDRSERLYDAFSRFANSLNGNPVMSIDPSNQGSNNIEATANDCYASLIASKDVYEVLNATDFIEVNLGDNDLCKKYFELNQLYMELVDIAKRKTTKEDEKKILSIKRMV